MIEKTLKLLLFMGFFFLSYSFILLLLLRTILAHALINRLTKTKLAKQRNETIRYLSEAFKEYQQENYKERNKTVFFFFGFYDRKKSIKSNSIMRRTAIVFEGQTNR